MPDNLSAINATTRRYVRTTPALIDGIYNPDPIMAMLRTTLREDFTGGNSINEDFLYAPMKGGSYARGKTFNTTEKQNEQQLRFDLRTAQVSVPFMLEDSEITNTGPLAFIKLLKSRVDQAYMTMGQFAAIMLYMNGQNAVTGHPTQVNGLTEAISDGTSTTWDGQTYTTYGSLTRASFPGLSSPKPYNFGGGSLEFDQMEQQYQRVNYGNEYEPNIVGTTPRGMGIIRSRLQINQRFVETRMEVATIGVGFGALSFNAAKVVASRMIPGSFITADGGTTAQDPVVAEYMGETFGVATNYPVGNLSTAGETLWFLNARKPFLNYYVSTSESFGGGFREFIPQQDGTKIVGQVLLAHNITAFPRYHTYMYAFAS